MTVKINKKNKKFILTFICSMMAYLLFALPLRSLLSVATVTDIRIAAVLNPVLGLAYGWSTALGCAIANFIADIVSGYGVAVAFIGFVPQVLYGILPYYLWKIFVPFSSHRTRLDSPKKVLLFLLVMLANAVPIGLSVGGLEVFSGGNEFWKTAFFAGVNDFDLCMVLGLPLMALLDMIYTKKYHAGKRKLSLNERVILQFAAAQFICMLIITIITYIYYANKNESLAVIWTDIYTIGAYFINGFTLVSVGVMFLFNSYRRKNSKLQVIRSARGNIFVDEKKHLEFVSLPSCELKYKLKADCFGFSDENARERKYIISYETAWYIMLCNQKGCPMNCVFCDCPAYGFYGNVTRAELNYQVEQILKDTPVTETNYMEIDFMRMGEPTFNTDILDFIEFDLKEHIGGSVNAEMIYPYISTMLPRSNRKAQDFILNFCRIKNEVYDGNAAIQFSINTTDEEARNKMFNNRSMSLADIARIGEQMPLPKGRKYALNFAVTRKTIIDAEYIDRLFDKNKFLIKITPIHETFNAVDNGFNITSEYESFEVYRKFEDSFHQLGWDVIVYLDNKEDDDDALTCGQLVLSHR